MNTSLRNVLIKSAHWRVALLSTQRETAGKNRKKNPIPSVKWNNSSDGRALTDKRRIHNSRGAKASFLTSYYVCTLEMLGSDFPAGYSGPISLRSPAHQAVIIKYVFDFPTIHSLSQ